MGAAAILSATHGAAEAGLLQVESETLSRECEFYLPPHAFGRALNERPTSASTLSRCPGLEVPTRLGR